MDIKEIFALISSEGLAIVGFVFLLIYTVRESKKREDRLLAELSKLTDIKDIREDVKEIKDKMKERGR